MNDDFKYDPVKKVFTAEAVETDIESVIGEIVLLMNMKRSSLSRYLHPGDWFFNPFYGTRNYEVQTMQGATDRIQNETEVQLNKHLVRSGRVRSVSVTTSQNMYNFHQVDIKIAAVQKNGQIVEYTHFVEVV